MCYTYLRSIYRKQKSMHSKTGGKFHYHLTKKIREFIKNEWITALKSACNIKKKIVKTMVLYKNYYRLGRNKY